MRPWGTIDITFAELEIRGAASYPTAARRHFASATKTEAKGERGRQMSAMVLPGVGLTNGRISSCPRRFSTGTASEGSSVIPAPLETIWVSVTRLVARKRVSLAFAFVQRAST